MVCFLGGLYTGQNLEQNKLLAILEADAKVWERSEYAARLSDEKTGQDLWNALEYGAASPSTTPERTGSTLNLLAAAAAASMPTPTPTAAPTAKPTATPTPTPRPTKTPIVIVRPTATPTPRPTATKTVILLSTPSTKISAWVTGDSANVRRGASTSYGVVEKLYYGEKLYIIDKTAQNGWYKVQTQSGNVGYVSSKLISTSQPTTRNSSGGTGSGGSSSQQSRTVYVSRTGKCYHSYAGCSDMNNPLAMTEAEAIARGRRRCQKCW